MRYRAIRTPSTRSNGCSSAIRKNSGNSVSRWRPVRIPRWKKKLGTGFRGRPTFCRKFALSRTRPLSWPWRHGYGGRLNWLARRRGRRANWAARVWRQAELAGAAAGALLKLRAAGVDAEETMQPGIEPRLRAGEAAFGPLWQAVRDRRPVSFDYRAAGRSEAQRLHLQPWGVVNRHGRWYVAGHDTGREAARVFRLSRIEGQVEFSGPPGSVTVPEGIDVRETVREWDSPPPPQRSAVLRVRPGAGHGIRRYATSEQPDSGGWDLIHAPFSDVGWFAEHIASFGTDVIAIEPADLREAVMTQLKGALA